MFHLVKAALSTEKLQRRILWFHTSECVISPLHLCFTILAAEHLCTQIVLSTGNE